jgi:restriction system protein
MTLYLVRAGKYGDRERVALKNNVVTIGWNEFSDLSGIKKMRVVNGSC